MNEKKNRQINDRNIITAATCGSGDCTVARQELCPCLFHIEIVQPVKRDARRTDSCRLHGRDGLSGSSMRASVKMINVSPNMIQPVTHSTLVLEAVTGDSNSCCSHTCNLPCPFIYLFVKNLLGSEDALHKAEQDGDRRPKVDYLSVRFGEPQLVKTLFGLPVLPTANRQ